MSWIPDEMVVEAVLDGRLTYATLSMEDSRWVVAVLSHRGNSVAEIAGWLRCSTRQVKRVRAELVTQVMGVLLVEREEHAGDTRRIANLRTDNARLREECAVLEARSDVQVLAALSQVGGCSCQSRTPQRG